MGCGRRGCVGGIDNVGKGNCKLPTRLLTRLIGQYVVYDRKSTLNVKIDRVKNRQLKRAGNDGVTGNLKSESRKGTPRTTVRWMWQFFN